MKGAIKLNRPVDENFWKFHVANKKTKHYT